MSKVHWKDCTKEELDAFVKAYPRKLVIDINRTCEPPFATYNDFTLGNWPDSTVAGYMAMGGNPDNIWDNVPSGFSLRIME